MIRVAITGPESTGKSALAKAMADHFQTTYAPEFAREYLEENGLEYTIEDLDKICLGQIAAEEKALAAAKKICFFDTDMLVLKIWSVYRFGRVSDLIGKALRERTYDHHLLCKPDLPWMDDPLRESPNREERELLFEQYRNELNERSLSYSIVSGHGNSRYESAIAALGSLGFS